LLAVLPNYKINQMPKINPLVPYLFSFLFVLSCSKSDSNEPIEPEVQIELPSLMTSAVTDIGETSATSGGNITNDGGAEVTERGVVWGTSSGPTILDNKTSDAKGTGTFSSNLENLAANTTYYVRAYATNSEGTAYGNEISFVTLEPEPVAKIFEGDVILTSQQEVNDFGAENYTELTGYLYIVGNSLSNMSNITDLTPLKSIQKVEDLLVRWNGMLENLDGLQNITGRVQNLKILDNSVLDDLRGLQNVEIVESEFFIMNNEGLTTIDSFNELLSAGSFEISNNASLKVISGFENFLDTAFIFIRNNTRLEQISGFVGLEFLEFALDINENDNLSQIKAFENLRNIRSGLKIYENRSLKIIEGFQSLVNVNTIDIFSNDELEALIGFDILKETTTVAIGNHQRLKEVRSFENLETVESFVFSNNYNFLSGSSPGLTFLKNLTNVDKLIIQLTANFPDLSGLEKLTNCKSVRIQSNIDLINFCALENNLLTEDIEQFEVSNNAFNPTLDDIIAGNCSE